MTLVTQTQKFFWNSFKEGGIKFIRALYGQKGDTPLTQMRYNKWIADREG